MKRKHFIAANPKKGFNFGFFIIINCEDKNQELQMIGETNNGRVNNSKLIAGVKTYRTVSTRAEQSGMIGRELQGELKNSVMIVPCFTRPSADTPGGNIYTHSLSREALECEDHGLKRIDEQYLAMVDTTREFLQKKGYKVSDKLIMTGFSAAGKFARRMKFLHPERVQAVVTGGLDFPPMQREQIGGKKLNYPLGIADYEQITGRTYSEEEQSQIPEYMFIGGDDENDFTQYDECISQEEREILTEIYGEGTVQEKWDSMQEVVKGRPNYHLRKIPGVKHRTTGIMDSLRADLENIVPEGNIRNRPAQQRANEPEKEEATAGFVERVSDRELQAQSSGREQEQQKIVSPEQKEQKKALEEEQERTAENDIEKVLE